MRGVTLSELRILCFRVSFEDVNFTFQNYTAHQFYVVQKAVHA